MDVSAIVFIVIFALLVAFVTLGIHSLVLRVRSLFWMFPRLLAGSMDQETGPRSLSSYEPALLPRIRRDFPDFSITQAKTKARAYIKESFPDKKGLKVHNVVISQYLDDGLEKAIVFQASVSWQEGGTVQKRFDIHYSYLVPEGAQAVAGNCPNCGAAIGYGDVECAYCGSRVTNVMGQCWVFTQILES